jgi:hypothetical protein
VADKLAFALMIIERYHRRAAWAAGWDLSAESAGGRTQLPDYEE